MFIRLQMYVAEKLKLNYRMLLKYIKNPAEVKESKSKFGERKTNYRDITHIIYLKYIIKLKR